MNLLTKLEYARWIVAGSIFGAAVGGVVAGGLGLELSNIGHDKIGAIAGGIITAIMVKVTHLV